MKKRNHHHKKSPFVLEKQDVVSSDDSEIDLQHLRRNEITPSKSRSRSRKSQQIQGRRKSDVLGKQTETRRRHSSNAHKFTLEVLSCLEKLEESSRVHRTSVKPSSFHQTVPRRTKGKQAKISSIEDEMRQEIGISSSAESPIEDGMAYNVAASSMVLSSHNDSTKTAPDQAYKSGQKNYDQSLVLKSNTDGTVEKCQTNPETMQKLKVKDGDNYYDEPSIMTEGRLTRVERHRINSPPLSPRLSPIQLFRVPSKFNSHSTEAEEIVTEQLVLNKPTRPLDKHIPNGDDIPNTARPDQHYTIVGKTNENNLRANSSSHSKSSFSSSKHSEAFDNEPSQNKNKCLPSYIKVWDEKADGVLEIVTKTESTESLEKEILSDKVVTSSLSIGVLDHVQNDSLTKPSRLPLHLASESGLFEPRRDSDQNSHTTKSSFEIVEDSSTVDYESKRLNYSVFVNPVNKSPTIRKTTCKSQMFGKSFSFENEKINLPNQTIDTDMSNSSDYNINHDVTTQCAVLPGKTEKKFRHANDGYKLEYRAENVTKTAVEKIYHCDKNKSNFDCALDGSCKSLRSLALPVQREMFEIEGESQDEFTKLDKQSCERSLFSGWWKYDSSFPWYQFDGKGIGWKIIFSPILLFIGPFVWVSNVLNLTPRIRLACQNCWRCDEDEYWFSCKGKGSGIICLLIPVYALLGPLIIAFTVLTVILLACCGDSKPINSQTLPNIHSY